MPNKMMMDPGSVVREGEMGGMGAMPMDPGSAMREGELNPSNPGPQEDLALVTSVMKMLDPSSAVREGEASSGDMSNLFGRLQELAQQVMQGRMLSEPIRKSLANQAVSLMDSQSAMRGSELGYMVDNRAQTSSPSMKGYSVDGSAESMTPERYQEMVNSGQITQNPNLMGPR